MKKLILTTFVLTIAITSCFAFFNVNANSGFNTNGELSIDGKVLYFEPKTGIGLVVPVNLNFNLLGEDRVGRMTKSVGIGTGIPNIGFALVFGNLLGVDVFGNYQYKNFTFDGTVGIYLEKGSHESYNYGSWRGVYKEEYRQLKFELGSSYNITDYLLVSLHAGIDWGWTDCYDYWGGSKWKPATTTLGSEERNKWTQPYAKISIGYQYKGAENK